MQSRWTGRRGARASKSKTGQRCLPPYHPMHDDGIGRSGRVGDMAMSKPRQHGGRWVALNVDAFADVAEDGACDCDMSSRPGRQGVRASRRGGRWRREEPLGCSARFRRARAPLNHVGEFARASLFTPASVDDRRRQQTLRFLQRHARHLARSKGHNSRTL